MTYHSKQMQIPSLQPPVPMSRVNCCHGHRTLGCHRCLKCRRTPVAAQAAHSLMVEYSQHHLLTHWQRRRPSRVSYQAAVYQLSLLESHPTPRRPLQRKDIRRKPICSKMGKKTEYRRIIPMTDSELADQGAVSMSPTRCCPISRQREASTGPLVPLVMDPTTQPRRNRIPGVQLETSWHREIL